MIVDEAKRLGVSAEALFAFYALGDALAKLPAATLALLKAKL